MVTPNTILKPGYSDLQWTGNMNLTKVIHTLFVSLVFSNTLLHNNVVELVNKKYEAGLASSLMYFQIPALALN